MAKRTARQNIIDKLETATRKMDTAEDLLAQVASTYFDAGKKQGALLDLLREGIHNNAELIKRFRREWV